MSKYYELEEPIVIKSIKNVVKIYSKYGKVQVFPRVDKSKHGIGRGATIDLEAMNLEDLEYLRNSINTVINSQREMVDL